MKEGNDLAMANLRRAADLVQSFKRTAVDQTSEQRREFQLSEVLSDVVYSLRPLFKHSQVEIVVQCPENLQMSGLPGVMSQVFTNLLLNAHAHAFDDGKKSGHVYIAAQADAGQVQLTVRDDGHGMTEDTLQKAFEPFYTTRRNSGGSGLGLYIVYSLVTHKLGGSITCESSPGAGSNFRICMPYQTKKVAEAQT
jgi:signal transduction histidine kinase